MNRNFDRPGRFNRPFRDGFKQNTEKHKIICSECGKEAEVNFKPTEGRKVYCADCWKKRRGF